MGLGEPSGARIREIDFTIGYTRLRNTCRVPNDFLADFVDTDPQNMAQLPLYYKNSKPTGPSQYASKKWKEYYLIGILFVAFIVLIAGVLWFVPDTEVYQSFDRAYNSFTGGVDSTQPTLLSEPKLTVSEVPSLKPGEDERDAPVLLKPPDINGSIPATLKQAEQNKSAAREKNDSKKGHEQMTVDQETKSEDSESLTTQGGVKVDPENERRRLKIIEVWMYLCAVNS